MKLVRALALGLAACSAYADDNPGRPPFVTTPPEVVERMLQLAGTRPDDFVIDLGSGDGRIVIAAVQKFGARGLGIELDGILVSKSMSNARAAGVTQRAEFVQGDVLVADISRASVITTYLLPTLMRELQPRFIGELAPGTRIVSHAFTMTGWAPDRTETVKVTSREFGQGGESRIHLWIVPAEVRGVWRGPGIQVRIEQNFQKIDVEGASRASLSGRNIAWEGFRGQVDGNRIIGELAGRPVELQRSR